MWTKDYFDKGFEQPDPWKFFTSAYELDKYRLQVRVLKDHLAGPVRSILEIGCAEGAHSKMLAEEFPDAGVLALDISAKAVARARNNLRTYPSVRVVEADILDFIETVPDGSLDIIVFSETVYYLGDRLSTTGMYEFLGTLCAKLGPGGLLCMANIVEQPDVPETPLTRRGLLNAYHAMLRDHARPVHTSTHLRRKEESNKTYEYELWVFQRG